jgi:Ca2+-binding RTX toxin-like protein
LTGTSCDEYLIGYGGKDTLDGKGGKDVMIGGPARTSSMAMSARHFPLRRWRHGEHRDGRRYDPWL